MLNLKMKGQKKEPIQLRNTPGKENKAQ